MKLSVDIFSVRRHFGDEKAVKMIKEAGFDAVDYGLIKPEIQGPLLDDEYLERASKIKTLLSEYELVCNQTHAPFIIKAEDDFSPKNPKFLEFIRALEFASVLGAKCLVVHGIGVSDEADFFDVNFKFYKKLEEYSKKFNVKIAVENLLWYGGVDLKGCLRTPDEVKEFLKALSSPQFTFCFDSGHSALCGVKPQDFIEKMDSDTLTALHIHDNDFVSDKHTFPYSGDFDWDAVCDALAKIGYCGDFTYELPGIFGKLPPELFSDALVYAEKVGRRLIKKIENK